MMDKAENQEDVPAEMQYTTSSPSTSHPAAGAKVETKRPREYKRRNLLPLRKGHRCSAYGCNRSFLNMQDLINHVSVHYRPTQSLQDKKFLCSMNSCTASLDSMQDLMNHLKVHYKPNRYFKCENCMQHFRTHRSLFKHLHVCTDNSSWSKSKSFALLPPTSDAKPTMSCSASRHTSVIRCIKKEESLPKTENATTSSTEGASTSLPGAPLPSMNNLVSWAPSSLPAFDPSLFGGHISSPSQSSLTGSFPFLYASTYNLPQASMSQKLRPFTGNQGLQVSNAMWKKNQGHTNNSRIIWEHTRGCYNCMQCSFTTDTRDQMDKHIEELHKNQPCTRLQEDTDCNIDLPFHSKLPTEIESSFLTQI